MRHWGSHGLRGCVVRWIAWPGVCRRGGEERDFSGDRFAIWALCGFLKISLWGSNTLLEENLKLERLAVDDPSRGDLTVVCTCLSDLFPWYVGAGTCWPTIYCFSTNSHKAGEQKL
ncbi:unnamed protein product [Tuber aestivum]|uniref:Uncharacterized protein n=1 Tax=Tuber aestivum TaxID=59557 RepID=A0A292Q1H6_9PEZI|nr:unnamed protein product [Tuber aestivum]